MHDRMTPPDLSTCHVNLSPPNRNMESIAKGLHGGVPACARSLEGPPSESIDSDCILYLWHIVGSYLALAKTKRL